MDALAQHLARDLEVRSGVEVQRLQRAGGSWRIMSSEAEVVAEADAVLVTIPPAQAVPLLTEAGELAHQARKVTMKPCWAVLLGFAGPVPVEFDAAFINVGSLAWVARNSSKPGRSGGEAWVLHASADWSRQHLERDAAEVVDLLRTEFARRWVGSNLPNVMHAEAHRWRYAQPENPLEDAYLFDEDQQIGIAGDWCDGPCIEGAFLSGMELAERILGRAAD
jgi:predicted NAD/FAD-dependent oxidoreductase